MPEQTAREKGEAAYARADAALGIKPAPSDPLIYSLPFIRWILEGRAPSLWVLSRLLLALGLVSIGAGILLGLGGAVIIWAVFEENGTYVAVNALVSGFTFGVPAALFMVGAAVSTYLAARNDREAGREMIEASGTAG